MFIRNNKLLKIISNKKNYRTVPHQKHKDMQTVAVRRRKFANILIQRGHHILGITQNKEYPKQSVYIFEKTQNLQTDLSRLLNGEYLE